MSLGPCGLHDEQWYAYSNGVDRTSAKFCLFCEVEQLTAALALLRADAERYRFLKRQYVQTHSPQMDGTRGYRFSHGWPALSGASFDEAVDFAAMVVKEAAQAAKGVT